jgi:O-antigen/teichoic acid export membrane protein
MSKWVEDPPECPRVDPAKDPKPKIERPEMIKKLWGFSIVFLVLLVLFDLAQILAPQIFGEHHEPHFVIETSFGFSAWYGFVACFLMVVVSKKLVGMVLSRRDSYYDD